MVEVDSLLTLCSFRLLVPKCPRRDIQTYTNRVIRSMAVPLLEVTSSTTSSTNLTSTTKRSTSRSRPTTTICSHLPNLSCRHKTSLRPLSLSLSQCLNSRCRYKHIQIRLKLVHRASMDQGCPTTRYSRIQLHRQFNLPLNSLRIIHKVLLIRIITKVSKKFILFLIICLTV